MLTYKRINIDNNTITYEFYHNGDTTMPGVVRFSEHEEPQLISDSIGDIKIYYATHALYGIDKTKEFGTVAWY